MKKIVGLLKPFDMVQSFYVYEDGDEIEHTQIKISEIPDTVLELSALYNANQIDLVGCVSYSKGIKKQIQEKEIAKYSNNKLTINCI